MSDDVTAKMIVVALVTWVLLALFNGCRAERLQDEVWELRRRTCPAQVDRAPGGQWRAPRETPASPHFL